MISSNETWKSKDLKYHSTAQSITSTARGQQDISWLLLCSPHGDTRKDHGHETNEFRSPPQQKSQLDTSVSLFSAAQPHGSNWKETFLLSWTWIGILISLLLLTTNRGARDPNPKWKFLRFAVSHWVDGDKKKHFSFLKFQWKYRGNISRKKKKKTFPSHFSYSPSF